tara:strand:- start:1861 stop:2232 length:372 start_codon:yes stop_codon:yes gene_type:complete
MTAPNLKSPTTITGKTTFVGINTTAKVGILTNLQDSNKVLKVNSIFAANIDGTSDALVNVSIANTVGTASTSHLAYNFTVLSQTTQIVTSKETYFYLEEGHKLDVQVTSVDDIDVIVGYEEIA